MVQEASTVVKETLVSITLGMGSSRIPSDQLANNAERNAKIHEVTHKGEWRG